MTRRLALVGRAYGAIHPLAASSPPTLFLARFALLFLLFLAPTFFMGGTLPLLLDALVGRDRVAGSLTSLLYGLNILGAVAGVLATSYLAIPRLGMNGSSLAFGVGNLLIGAVALAVFRRTRPLHPATAGPDRAPRIPAFFVILAAVSGFIAIGYQVAWIRYFGLFQVASVHRTAVLLAVYLLALALGSLVLAPILTCRVRRGAGDRPGARVLDASRGNAGRDLRRPAAPDRAGSAASRGSAGHRPSGADCGCQR
jgi:spermidine synthase